MNYPSPHSSPHSLFSPQGLPLSNIVKPRILQNRSISPMISYIRTNNHYNSPQMTLNRDNSMNFSINTEKKPIFYSPLEGKTEFFQRNLSPQAMIVLDILNKIKETSGFQMKKHKLQAKFANERQNEKNKEKTNEKTNEKNNEKNNEKINEKIDEIDEKINEKIKEFNEKNHKKVKEKTEINTITSQKSYHFSPKNSPKNQEISLENSSQKFDFSIKFPMKNAENSSKDIKQKLSSPLQRNSQQNIIKKPNSPKKNEENSMKSPLNEQKTLKISEIPIKSLKTNIKEDLIANNKENFEVLERTADLIRKTSQEKEYIQDLLGKLDNCLSKTTNLLNKPINEAKNGVNLAEEKILQKTLDFPISHKKTGFFEEKISEKTLDLPEEKYILQKNTDEKLSEKTLDFPEVQKKTEEKILLKNDDFLKEKISQKNNDFLKENISQIKLEKGEIHKFDEEKTFNKQEFLQQNSLEEFNQLKIPISPVKEVQLESNDPIIIQNQIRNGENSEEKTNENSKENSKKHEENPYFIEKNTEKEHEIAEFLQKKSTNFINNDLIFEDKENNINVYHNKSPLSKENSTEILKESSQKNIGKNDENQQEYTYNMQIITKILQSNNEEISEIQRNYEGKTKRNSEENLLKKEKLEEFPIKKEKFEEFPIKTEEFSIKKEKIDEFPIKKEEFLIKNKKFDEFPMKKERIDEFPIKKEEFPIKSFNSYAQIAHKNQKNKELQVKQSQILQQITNIDKEIQTMELDSQKSSISDKMLRFKDNYKAYKHKLPSIQENEDSIKRKSPISLEKPQDFQKKNSMKKLEIVKERCEKLYIKGVESSQRRIKEFEQNLKKSDEKQRNLCTFKPDFIAKKANEIILSQREKNRKSEKNPEKNDFRRNLSQNSLKNARNILKLNKSMSPQRNFGKNDTNPNKNHYKNYNKPFEKSHDKIIEKNTKKNIDKTIDKNGKLLTNRTKPLISPRSTSSCKSRRTHKENQPILMNNHNNNYLLTKEPMNKGLDPLLNVEIFDILKIFSGINEVLTQKTLIKTEKIDYKMRDISPIKPNYIEETNKSFNEVSINQNNENVLIDSRKSSFEKVLGLMDQKHQHLFLKSVEMTKKVDQTFKEIEYS